MGENNKVEAKLIVKGPSLQFVELKNPSDQEYNISKLKISEREFNEIGILESNSKYYIDIENLEDRRSTYIFLENEETTLYYKIRFVKYKEFIKRIKA